MVRENHLLTMFARYLTSISVTTITITPLAMLTTNELQTLADMISANVARNTKNVLSADEAAAYLNVSKSYLYKLTIARKIPFSKPLGKMCYFDRLELEAWLLSNRVATSDEITERAQAYCAHTHVNKKGGAR